MTYAYDNGIMKENSIVYKDLFDTKLMGCLVNAPSVIRARFKDYTTMSLHLRQPIIFTN